MTECYIASFHIPPNEMLNLTLPDSIGSRDIASLFNMCGKLQRTEERHVTFDGSKTTFIDPLGLAVMGAALHKLNFESVHMHWLSKDVTSYLTRMDFFTHFEVQGVDIPAQIRNEVPDKVCELTRVDSHAESDTVANRLADALTGVLTKSSRYGNEDEFTGLNQFDRFRQPIFYSLSELLENALTHARQKGNLRANVWVASQYYQKSGIVRMAVVDNGCGFLPTLEKHPRLVNMSHLGAIRTALIPTVSCNRDGMLYDTQANQGVGLTTTERIAKAAQGGLTIASGDGWYRTQEFNKGGVLPYQGYWPGVAIGFQCRRNKLPTVRVGELLPPEPIADIEGIKFV